MNTLPLQIECENPLREIRLNFIDQELPLAVPRQRLAALKRIHRDGRKMGDTFVVQRWRYNPSPGDASPDAKCCRIAGVRSGIKRRHPPKALPALVKQLFCGRVIDNLAIGYCL